MAKADRKRNTQRRLKPALSKAAGNAAFDAAEYLDAVIAAGRQPLLVEGCDDKLSYGEVVIRRPTTDAERQALYAVQVKYGQASTADARADAECLRRGLICRS